MDRSDGAAATSAPPKTELLRTYVTELYVLCQRTYLIARKCGVMDATNATAECSGQVGSNTRVPELGSAVQVSASQPFARIRSGSCTAASRMYNCDHSQFRGRAASYNYFQH